MTVSVVLRLIPAELLAGRIVGEAEVVATGERRVVRSSEELMKFLGSLPDGGQGDPRSA